jgi:hypothetical protein
LPDVDLRDDDLAQLIERRIDHQTLDAEHALHLQRDVLRGARGAGGRQDGDRERRDLPAKVIVIEFKLPIDERAWVKDEKSVFPVESGTGFWLGFMIDDNDLPGAGLQKLETWPSGYGTFAPKEDGVWVTFE